MVKFQRMQEGATTECQPAVFLTENAASHIKELLRLEEEREGKFLRVYVEGGGCSGMQYGLVFDQRRGDDLAFEYYGLTVLVDPFSANYLHGARIDYLDSLNDSGLKIYNPNARETCGCGKSFQA